MVGRFLAAFAWASAAAAETACDLKTMEAVLPPDTTMISAAVVQSPIPNRKVEGYVTASHPGPNRVNFRVQLPDAAQWNHRFSFMGLGEAAGSMPPAPPNFLGASA